MVSLSFGVGLLFSINFFFSLKESNYSKNKKKKKKKLVTWWEAEFEVVKVFGSVKTMGWPIMSKKGRFSNVWSLGKQKAAAATVKLGLCWAYVNGK